jgi:hypothetical protein
MEKTRAGSPHYAPSRQVLGELPVRVVSFLRGVSRSAGIRHAVKDFPFADVDVRFDRCDQPILDQNVANGVRTRGRVHNPAVFDD